MSSSIVAVGTLAFDSIETPFGKAPHILGGSVNYFSLSASLFTKVQCVSVVGEDFPKPHLEFMEKRGIDTSGIRIAPGKTFHWTGSYGYDLNEARTLATHLNVFEKFEPHIPEAFRNTKFVFLGNLAPELQTYVLTQIKNPGFVAIDTMNFWIEGKRDALVKAISKCNALIINEAELRQLTKLYNIVQAAEMVQGWGPRMVVVKRGEYGAVLFDGGQAFGLPALPLQTVKDPTGAGDTFAGGFMGYLAAEGNTKPSGYALRRAVVYGCIMASFTVQDFGVNQLLTLKRSQVDERYKEFIELTSFHIN